MPSVRVGGRGESWELVVDEGKSLFFWFGFFESLGRFLLSSGFLQQRLVRVQSVFCGKGLPVLLWV